MDDVETTDAPIGTPVKGRRPPPPRRTSSPLPEYGIPTAAPIDAGRFEPALSVMAIGPSPFNRKVDSAKLGDLIESIRTHGVINPITVRPIETLAGIIRFEIVAGERRWRASEPAGRTTIPAIVRELTDEQVIEIQLIENLKREDLHPLEEADTYQRLLALPGWTEERVAERSGQRLVHVRERIRLTRLTPVVRELFAVGKLGLEVALLIGRMPAIAELQDQAAKEIAEGERIRLETEDHRYEESVRPLTVREAQDLLRSKYMTRLERATWPLDDAELVPAAGACATCPKRTGNQRDLFAEIKSPDICTDPTCFRTKTDAQYKRTAAEAKGRGLKVLSDKDAKAVFGPHVDHDRGVTAIKHDSKLVDVAGRLPYGVPGYYDNKTWSTVLEGVPDAPQIHIAKDPQTGAVRQLVDRDAALKAASKAGNLKATRPERSKKSDAEKRAEAKERDQRAKEKQREAIERGAFQRVLSAIAIGKAPRLERSLWRWLGQALSEQLGEGEEVVLVRRGFIEEESKGRPGPGKDHTKDLAKWFDKATVEELRGFALEVLVAQFRMWNHDHARVEELCGILGIDRKAHLEAARKAVEAEAQVAAAVIKWKGLTGKAPKGRTYTLRKSDRGYSWQTKNAGSGPFPTEQVAKESAELHAKSQAPTGKGGRRG